MKDKQERSSASDRREVACLLQLHISNSFHEFSLKFWKNLYFEINLNVTKLYHKASNNVFLLKEKNILCEVPRESHILSY